MNMHRVYCLRVVLDDLDGLEFTTLHDRLTWALKYAMQYRASWPTARLTLVSTVEVW